MKTTLTLEVSAFALILVVTSVLVSYTPPKVLIDSQLKQRITSSVSSSALYTDIPLTFDNGQKGVFTAQRIVPGNPNMLMVLFDAKTKMKPKTVDLYLSNSKLKIVDLHVKLLGYGNSFMAYQVLPAGGLWQINAQAILDEFTETQANVAANLK